MTGFDVVLVVVLATELAFSLRSRTAPDGFAHGLAVREYHRRYRGAGSRLGAGAERRLWTYSRTVARRDLSIGLLVLIGVTLSLAAIVRLESDGNVAWALVPLSITIVVGVVEVWRVQYAAIRGGRPTLGRASLAVRTTRQFVPRWLRLAPALVLASLVVAVWIWVRGGDHTTPGAPSALFVAAVVVIAGALLVVGDFVLRSALLAPLPADPPELAQVESLIRAIAMRRIVGAELGAVFCASWFVLGAFGDSSELLIVQGRGLVLLAAVSFLGGQWLRTPRMPLIGDEPDLGPVAG